MLSIAVALDTSPHGDAQPLGPTVFIAAAIVVAVLVWLIRQQRHRS